MQLDLFESDSSKKAPRQTPKPKPKPAMPLGTVPLPTLATLNPAQTKALRHTGSPALVLAGAGSGKTRLLTHRIAHLISECGLKPWQILAVTFTNKAAREMVERVVALVGDSAREINIGTFHSRCLRMLKVDIEALGYDRSFTIADTLDQVRIVKEIMVRKHLSEKTVKPRALLHQISAYKIRTLESKADPVASDFASDDIADLFSMYTSILRRDNVLDFDDLLFLSVKLLETQPEIRQKYQRRYRSILVDEYQDTNHIQYKLIKLLCAEHTGLMVVGDEDQSIYGWRGADITNILDFQKDYPGATVYHLEQNYRSTGNILKAANSVIRHNRDRLGKELWTDKPEGTPVKLMICGDSVEEAMYIASTIEDSITLDKRPNSDFGILYRTNMQSRAIEDELRRRAIPHQVIGSVGFYDRKEIKDVICYLRFLVNPKDTVSLMRILNVPARGIGKTSQEKLLQIIRESEKSAADILARVDSIASLSRPAKALKRFNPMILGLRELVDRGDMPVAEILRATLKETGYQTMLEKDNTPEGRGRIENVYELEAAMTEFDIEEREDKTLLGFLNDAALMTTEDTLDDSAGTVSLLTVHSAKGLEFPIVFVAGLEEKLFPHGNSMGSEKEIEEERRLCYVAMTRAEEQLHMSLAMRRNVFGKYQDQEMSRFVSEISSEYVEGSQEQHVVPESEIVVPTVPVTPRRKKPRSETGDSFVPGDSVLHSKWGPGKIVSVAGKGDDIKVGVKFSRDRKERKLLVKYARLVKM
ncbi:ATP-dependent helicase [Candidatus Hydrogenedentota bacterium]